MKILFDFFPILLFFIGFKLFNIYIATIVAITASLMQIVFLRLKYQFYDKMQLINFAVLLFLGGATLFFHNIIFIKWKPTGIYWLTALIFIGSLFIGQKPIIQKMLDSSISMPTKIWYRLNWAWSMFFIFLGSVNLYVAYNYDTNTWVNFKLFATLGFTVIFILLQTIYLSKYLTGRAMK